MDWKYGLEAWTLSMDLKHRLEALISWLSLDQLDTLDLLESLLLLHVLHS